MFLPKEKNKTTWGSACLAENTQICMVDGTFAIIQNSVGKEIWMDQQGKRKIIRIHKFDTTETDPPLLEIGGNWMTNFHFFGDESIPNGIGRLKSEWSIKQLKNP